MLHRFLVTLCNDVAIGDNRAGERAERGPTAQDRETEDNDALPCSRKRAGIVAGPAQRTCPPPPSDAMPFVNRRNRLSGKRLLRLGGNHLRAPEDLREHLVTLT